MAESRDPAIKLFGKTIQIPVGGVVSVTIGEEFIGYDEKVPSTKEVSPEPKDNSEEAATTAEEEKKKDESMNLTNEEKIDRNSSPENSKDDDEYNESSNNPQNKSIKKPDKILPCPRCKSMDTKFCYYNNYNINQPRHFCKNCQRYWTAGGSMRNVPVGAGRRKSKGSASSQHFRHMTIPDGVEADPESIPHFAEKTVKNRNQNVEEQLSGSSNSNEPVEVSTNSNCYGFPPNVSNFNGSPWPYPWTHPPIALPFYPITAYWNMPWLSNLGKHSREGNLFNHNQSSKGDSPIPEKCLWFPKKTRVDVPEKQQSAQCGQPWDSRMINADLISDGGGLFEAFQSNGGHKIHSTEISQALLANPAAFSRSFTFQESS